MSTVITPFQGTDSFSTATFNNRISQINTGFSYISNPNLLDNWYFGNPVDQRGGYVVPKGVRYWQDTSGYPEIGITESYYTVARIDNAGNPHFYIDGVEYYVDHNIVSPAYVRGYTGAGYGIDRWNIKTGTVRVENGKIVLVSGSGYQQFVDVAVNGEATLSILTESGLFAITGTLDQSVSGWQINKSFTGFWMGVQYGSTGLLDISITTTADTAIKAAKLELGSTQTLAHQDENGNWVLNEVPDYGEQLRRCQRCFVNFNPYKMPYFAMPPAVASNAQQAYSAVTLPVTMRAQPVVSYGGKIVLSQSADHAVTSISVSDNTFTGNSIQLRYNVSAGTLTANSLYRVQGNNDSTSYIWLSADL